MNTNYFVCSPPHRKSEMVKESFEFLSQRVEKLTAEMKTLTRWIDMMPTLIQQGEAQHIDATEFSSVYTSFKQNMDALTEQLAVTYNTINTVQAREE